MLYKHGKRNGCTGKVCTNEALLFSAAGIFLISPVQGAILLRFHGHSIFPCLEDTLCPGPSVFELFLPPLLGCSLSPGCRDGIVGEFIGPGYPAVTYFLHFNQLWVSVITSAAKREVPLVRGESYT